MGTEKQDEHPATERRGQNAGRGANLHIRTAAERAKER